MDDLIADAVHSVLSLVDARGNMRELNEALLDLEIVVEKMRTKIEED